MKTNNKGFSLVELIVVIAIMAILAAVAIPTFASFIDKANIASDVSFVNDLTYAAELAHTATGDKVTDVQVKVGTDGLVDEVTYKVGTVEVTIAVDNAGKATTADDVDANNDVAKAAEDAANAIDWTYKFKKYDGKTFQINPDDPKTLAEVTVTENP